MSEQTLVLKPQQPCYASGFNHYRKPRWHFKISYMLYTEVMVYDTLQVHNIVLPKALSDCTIKAR